MPDETPYVCLLSEAPVDPFAGEPPGDEEGAVLQFLGVVRRLEKGRPLEGIRYSCYERMVKECFEKMVARAEERFGPHRLFFQHRLGMVRVAEPSVIIRVSTGHSPEAFALSQHYLRETKTVLPIWKEPVYAV